MDESSTNVVQTPVYHRLIDPDDYAPDTLDFRTDVPAQDYWTKCFEKLVVTKFTEQAVHSQCDDPTAPDRAAVYQKEYINETRMMISNAPPSPDERHNE